VLEELGQGLLEEIARAGALLGARLRELPARHPQIRDVRGAGLIWGIEHDGDTAAVVEACLARGVLVNRTADHVLRLLPPYVITEEELMAGVTVIDEAIADVKARAAA
jgi:4-aminobutyrate aminotransferase-like enzyme